jgi:hypothetical protein
MFILRKRETPIILYKSFVVHHNHCLKSPSKRPNIYSEYRNNYAKKTDLLFAVQFFPFSNIMFYLNKLSDTTDSVR